MSSIAIAETLEAYAEMGGGDLADVEEGAEEIRRLYNINIDLKAKVNQLSSALALIKHATAPTHSDGSYHEAAYEISTEALK